MTKDEALKMARTALGVQLDALLGKAGHLRNDDRRRYAENGIKAIDEALAQPEQEPVVWMYQDKSTHEVRFQKHMRDFVDHGATYETPLYATPPQRKPLTEEEIGSCIDEVNLTSQYGHHHFGWHKQFARAIEAAHGIKGEA